MTYRGTYVGTRGVEKLETNDVGGIRRVHQWQSRTFGGSRRLTAVAKLEMCHHDAHDSYESAP